MRPISYKSLMATGLVLFMVCAFVFSCASVETRPEDVGGGKILDRKPLSDPPTYRQLAASLTYYEKQLGIKFYKNKKGRYMVYATAGWKSFSIADDLNECLFDVNMKGLVTYRHIRGSTRSMIEMDIQRGPCGIRYPDADAIAQDKVTLMEGSVISPAIEEQLSGRVSLIRGSTFLQKLLALPWKVDSIEGGLEQAVSKVGMEVKNPLDVTFGDVVFFTEYYGERNVGLYVDYGYIVYNSCFRAQVRKMDSSINYRIYRVYTGFNMIRYKLHEAKFIREFVGGPE